MVRTTVLLLALLVASGCGKPEAAKEAARVAESAKPPVDRFPELRDVPEEDREVMRAVRERLAAKDPRYRAKIEDRQRLVSPAPPGFVPKREGRAIELRVVVRDRVLRRGENFWYRLEVQNVGSENVPWYENFFKRVGTGEPSWEYRLIEPDGRETELRGGPFFADLGDPFGAGTQLVFPEDWSEKRIEAELKRIAEQGAADSELHLTLYPGETVETAPWRFVPREEALERRRRGLPERPELSGRFREFTTRYRFERPGTYRLKVVWDQIGQEGFSVEEAERIAAKYGVNPESLLRYNKQGFGRVESNVAVFEVVP